MPVDALADAFRTAAPESTTDRGRRPRSRASPRAGPRASPGSPLPDRSRGGSPSHTGVPIPLSGFPARPAQPPEPILVPKLRIRLADFPYLHCSVWSEADHLGDLLRLSVRRPEQQSDISYPSLSQIFIGRPEHTGRRGRRGAFRDPWVPIIGRTKVRAKPQNPSYREENSTRGPRPASLG